MPEGKQVQIAATGVEYGSNIPELGLELACQSAEMHGIAENKAMRAEGEGEVMAHECVVVGAEKTCTIYPTEEDLINETRPGLVIASSGEIFVRSLGSARYLEGSAAATVYHGGAFCTLPEVVEISGTAAGKIAEAGTERVEHEVEDITQAEEEELEVAAFYGNSRLFVEQGHARGRLIGEFEGQTFSVN